MFSKVVTIFNFSIIFSFIIYIIFLISPKDIVESDYASFVTGAGIIANGQNSKLYDIETQENYQHELISNFNKNIFLPFRNLPIVAVFFLPFTHLTLIFGYKIFALFNIFLLFLYPQLVFEKKDILSRINLHLTIPFLFLGNINTILYSQLSIIITFVFVLIYKSFKRKNDFASGIFTGLIFIKPQYLVSLPFLYLISNKKMDFIKGFSISFLSLAVISFLVASPDFVVSYLNLIFSTENLKYGTNIGNMFSTTSALLYLSEHKLLNYYHAVILLLIFFIFTFVFFLKNREKWTLEKKLVFVVVISLVLAPHVLTHDLAFLTLPILLLFNKFLLFKKSRLLLIFALFLLFTLPVTWFWLNSNLVVLNAFLLVLILLKLSLAKY